MSDKPGDFGSPILVTGATNQIGSFLLPRLSKYGFEVSAISRRKLLEPDRQLGHTQWHRLDIESCPSINFPMTSRTLIHLAPLWILAKFLERLAELGLQRLVAVGSTSLFSKSASSDSAEKSIATRLAQAEGEIGALCKQYDIACTVFRPTLIYGAGMDQNISLIARIIKRYGFFPLVSNCHGLRQPVHADDIAKACVDALENPHTFGKAYNLSGGETLTYMDMVERIFLDMGKKPRTIRAPAWLYRAAISCLSSIPRFRHLTTAMVSRMGEDLCFDHQEAERDFNYRPRPMEFDATLL